MLVNCLAVGAGGFIGSVFRYLIGLMPFLSRNIIPFQTLLVNLVGAILIGMIVKSSESCEWLSGSMLLFLKVGICGGFTTFSTFSLESLAMLEEGRMIAFAAYVALSIVLCISGVYLGKLMIGGE